MLPSETLQRIEQALADLRYGSVQLIVHEGQIVRIERTERTRLTVHADASSLDCGESQPEAMRRHAYED